MTAKYLVDADGEVERLSMSKTETRLRTMLIMEPPRLVEKIFDLENVIDK
jgi:hypothetical protein